MKGDDEELSDGMVTDYASQNAQFLLHLYSTRFHGSETEKARRHLSAEWFWQLLDRSSDQKWRSVMRISKQLFMCIAERISRDSNWATRAQKADRLSRREIGPRGRPHEPTERVLGTVLCHLANGASASFHGRTLGTSQATMSRWKLKVLKALEALREEVIFWPDLEDYPVIQAGFDYSPSDSPRLPGVIGAIDGTHHRCWRSNGAGGEALYCHKLHPSVSSHAICDHRGFFTMFEYGVAGSTHDSTAWKDTPLYLAIAAYGEELLPDGCLLLADGAYELLRWQMKPFTAPPDGTSSRRRNMQEEFNEALSAARMTIERAFGRMKEMWRCAYDGQMDAYTGPKPRSAWPYYTTSV